MTETTPANWTCSDARAGISLVLSSCARASKVLVVESDRAVSEMLQIRLDVAGYHPLAARTGVSALEILRNMRPAALVLDAATVEMSAFEVLAIIQRGRTHLACPILLTGKKLGLEDIRRASTLGVQTCMVKPYGGAEVLERVAKLLKAATTPATAAPPISTAPTPPISMEVLL